MVSRSNRPIVEIKMKTKQLTIIIVALTILIGCAKADIPPLPTKYLEDDVYLSDNGEFILLTVPQQINAFKIGDSIGILVQNKSDYKFSYKYGDAKLFFLDKNKLWSEVGNTTTYIYKGKTEVGVSGNAETYSTILETFDTDIFYNKSTYLKVVIIGELSKESTDTSVPKKIAVAIDLKLNP
jgi:hypothetical protein